MTILYLYTFTSAPVTHKLFTQSYVFTLATSVKILSIDTYQMVLLVNAALCRKLLNTAFFTAHSTLKLVTIHHPNTSPRITLPYMCY